MQGLLAKENILKSILENMDDIILVKDNSSKIIYINNKIQEQLGYSPSELMGLCYEKAIKVLVGEKYLEDIKLVSEKLKTGLEVTEIKKFIHKSGVAVPLEVKTFSLYDEHSNICGELLILKDLHEELLHKITNLVNSSLSLDDVLRNTAFAVVEYLGLSSNAVFLLNETKDELRLVSHNAYPTQESMAKVIYKIGDAPPWRAIKQRSPIYIENIRIESTISEYARKFHQDKSSFVFPLRYSKEVLGAIAFDATSVRKYSVKELNLFQNITDQVALAIKNAQLFSKVEHLSITDGLTKLYNYRFFEGRLHEELERSKRNKSSFGVMMLDVDNFKNYNDSFGHLRGDDVLRHLAKLLQKNVRDFDIVARYGGEEFGIILFDCDKLMALDIGERIRAAIGNHNFYGRKKQPGGKVTVSIGLTMYPESRTVNKLISNADKALYSAKERGKNRVVLFSRN